MYTGFDDSIGWRVAEAMAGEALDRGFRAIELGGNVLEIVLYPNPETECMPVVDWARAWD